MKKLSEELGYIKGLRDGLKLEQNDVTKLLNRLVDAFGDMVIAMDKLEQSHDELSNYVESIDDDLAEIEMRFADEEDDEFDDDGFEDIEDDDELWLSDEDGETDDDAETSDARSIFPFPGGSRFEEDDLEDGETEDDESEDDDDDGFYESAFSGCLCPECEKMFCVTDPDFEHEDRLYRCPYCGGKVPLVPIEKGNIPIAHPVDEEE